MPYEIRTDPGLGLIALRLYGRMDLGEALTAIDQLLLELLRCPGLDVISDHRELDYRPSVQDLTQVVRRLAAGKDLLTGQLAIIPTEYGRNSGMVQIFTALADLVGLKLHVFNSPNDALYWLRPQVQASGGTEPEVGEAP